MAQNKLAKRIREAAYRARSKAELIALREAFAHNLEGFCARGSAILWCELKRLGLSPKIVFNPGHACVLCDGYFVDVTATQFGFKKTVVRSSDKRAVRRLSYWTTNGYRTIVFNNPMEFKIWQENNGWNLRKGMINTSDFAEFGAIEIVDKKKEEIEKKNIISRYISLFTNTWTEPKKMDMLGKIWNSRLTWVVISSLNFWHTMRYVASDSTGYAVFFGLCTVGSIWRLASLCRHRAN